jgi:hypothetical protein
MAPEMFASSQRRCPLQGGPPPPTGQLVEEVEQRRHVNRALPHVGKSGTTRRIRASCCFTLPLVSLDRR